MISRYCAGGPTSLPIEPAAAGSITARIAGFSIPGGRNPGMDPVVVFRATRHAVAQTRGGGWPGFLDFSSTSITRLSSGPAYDTGTWRRYRDGALATPPLSATS